MKYGIQTEAVAGWMTSRTWYINKVQAINEASSEYLSAHGKRSYRVIDQDGNVVWEEAKKDDS